jgi:hypothetical protein
MMNKYNDYKLTNGLPLDELGLYEAAFCKKDASAALNILRESDIAVLGGDVYVKNKQGIQPAYSNWCVAPVIGENHHDYVIRSCNEERVFIGGYSMVE